MLSQNKWPVLDQEHVELWEIPGTSRHMILQGRHAGFVLAYFAKWFNDNIEKLSPGEWDEWGWAVRDIRGSSEISNHASGTAMDLNAVQHPLGVFGTYKTWKKIKIHAKLLRLGGVIRWGEDYQGRKDGMHFEINKGGTAVIKLAKRLSKTWRGESVMQRNPWYREPR